MRLKWERILLLSLFVALCIQCVSDRSKTSRHSGIYLCGEFNHWHPDSNWEFAAKGNGRYVLYDKEVYINMIVDMRRAKEYDYPLWSGNGSGIPIVSGKPYRLTHSELHYIPSTYAVTRCDSIVLHIVDSDSATLTLHLSTDPQLPKTLDSLTVNAETQALTSAPGNVRVLGLGNSLLGYNRQDTLFNRLVQSLNIDAAFYAHWHHKYGLERMWEEGPCYDAYGGLSARALVASYPWTHVVLQEQLIVPMYDAADYASVVGRWVEYIRQNCPNPDVQVIVVGNWPLAMLWEDYDLACGMMQNNTRVAALRCGARVCPVGEAYREIFAQKGIDGVQNLYVDDRHPTLQASYLAACMELSLVTGIRPTEMSWHPAAVDDETALRLREIAERVLPRNDNIPATKSLNNSRRFVPLSGVDIDWSIVAK